MENEGIKLLGFWVSPFVLRVKQALKLKAVNYEYIEEDIFNKTPLIFKLNPVYKKVPVLVHDGKPLPESLIILEYIDETWNQDAETLLLPQDPYGRAMARFWARFADEKILEAAWKVLCYRGDEQEEALKSAIELLEKIEDEVKGKRFFGGDTIGYLDIALGWIAYMLPVWEEIASVHILDSSKFPGISKWTNNFVNHPIVKDELPPRDKMVVYFTERSEKYRLSKDV